MKNIMKHAFVWCLLAALLLFATACAQLAQDLDVIGQGSIASFEALLQAAPEQVEENAAVFGLGAPDGAAR